MNKYLGVWTPLLYLYILFLYLDMKCTLHKFKIKWWPVEMFDDFKEKAKILMTNVFSLKYRYAVYCSFDFLYYIDQVFCYSGSFLEINNHLYGYRLDFWTVIIISRIIVFVSGQSKMLSWPCMLSSPHISHC